MFIKVDNLMRYAVLLIGETLSKFLSLDPNMHV